MHCTDILLRHTDKKGGSYVQSHRVWDRDLFLTSQAADAAKEGGKSKVEVLTEAEYEKARGR